MTAERVVRIPRRRLAVVAPLVVIALVLAVPPSREAVVGAAATAWNPPLVADEAKLAAHREAGERAIGRGYAKAVDQLRRVRELRLPITDEEANAIQRQAVDELRGVRRRALSQVAQLYGLRGDEAAQYLFRADARLESAGLDSDPGVLLAPSLFSVVARANEAFAQIADRATREMTRPR